MNFTNAGKDFRALFSLDPDVKAQALLMFLYNFILLNTLYLLKPVRDSLFLEEVGAYNLPFVFILTALAVIPISIAYSRLSRYYSIGWVVSAVTLFLAANLFVIWFFIEMDHNWLYYGFYVWVSIYSVLITSQFWLFANTIFNSVQSKKVFGFLSLGAISGGFTGGELTAIVINYFSLKPESLLLISAIVITATTPLVWVILKKNGTSLKARPEPVTGDSPVSNNPLKEILKHNHLLLIVALIAVTVTVTTLIDYQFKTVAENAFASESALTSFMGKFYGRVSLIALLIQLFVGTIFTKKYGVSGALLLLPLALLISAGGMLIVPGLIAGTLSRGIDQSLKHSIDRTGRELLFVPLPKNLKQRVKVFIDLFVDHGSQGITGLLLLGLTFGLNLDVREISVVVIILLVAWIAIAKMVGNSYVDVFRNTLKRKVEKDWEEGDKKKRIPEKTSPETIRELLKSNEESDVLWALEAIKNKDIPSVDIDQEQLLKHVQHPSCKVRIKLLQLFREKEMGDLVDEVLELAYDEDPDVRMEAIRYVYQFYEADHKEKLAIGLNHEDVRIRAVVMGIIAEEGNEEGRNLITDELLQEALEYSGDSADELRRQMARVLPTVYHPNRARFIKELLHDENPTVVKQAIKAAGETQDRRFVHDLLLLMGNGVYRKTVEEALKNYGSRIYGTMYDHMVDPHLSDSIRRYIPWLFSQTVTDDSWDILKMSLKFCSIPIRHGVIKAMVRMRKQRKDLRVSDEIIVRNAEIELKRYSKLVKAYHIYKKEDLPLSENADEILKYEIEQTFENVFRLLSLNNDMDDIENAHKAIVGDNPQLKADAIEFIENLISWEIRKLLIPLLEIYNTDEMPENSFNSSLNKPEEVLRFLKEICHPELERELKPDERVQISLPDEVSPLEREMRFKVGD